MSPVRRNFARRLGADAFVRRSPVSARSRDLRRPRKVRGLSLLEVMLAIAIFGGALGVIGELVRIGSRNAEMARDLTTAQLLCETKMAEISAGLIPPEVVTSAPIEEWGEQDAWYYSIQVDPVDQQGMLSIWVVVEQNSAIYSRPVSYQLTRWMIDPKRAALESTTEGTEQR
ncbi:MAG: prepilin-type N-terminal cleavage/methylation domain-containing protein [Pirellulaceae bacterium]